MRSGVRAPGDAGVGNLGLQQKWRFLKKEAPQNHRFQYSDGLMMSNDLDDLEVPTVPPHFRTYPHGEFNSEIAQMTCKQVEDLNRNTRISGAMEA